jgi:hypothetical protein
MSGGTTRAPCATRWMWDEEMGASKCDEVVQVYVCKIGRRKAGLNKKV